MTTQDLPMPVARPQLDRRKLAHIADTLASVFAEHGWQWTAPADRGKAVADSRRYTPTAVDIVLAIVDRLPDLGPGGTISSGQIAVVWEYDEANPENREYAVYLDLGSISPETRP